MPHVLRQALRMALSQLGNKRPGSAQAQSGYRQRIWRAWRIFWCCLGIYYPGNGFLQWMVMGHGRS